MSVVTGWGVQMIRLGRWKSAAKLHEAGLKVPGATVSAWRAQTGSRARKWPEVAQEATELIALETMCRLLGTASGMITDQDMCNIVDWPALVVSGLFSEVTA